MVINKIYGGPRKLMSTLQTVGLWYWFLHIEKTLRYEHLKGSRYGYLEVNNECNLNIDWLGSNART